LVGDYAVSVVHVGVRSLPKLCDRDCLTCKRSCDIAAAPAALFFHLAVADDEPTVADGTFPTARPVCPARVPHRLTEHRKAVLGERGYTGRLCYPRSAAQTQL